MLSSTIDSEAYLVNKCLNILRQEILILEQLWRRYDQESPKPNWVITRFQVNTSSQYCPIISDLIEDFVISCFAKYKNHDNFIILPKYNKNWCTCHSAILEMVFFIKVRWLTLWFSLLFEYKNQNQKRFIIFRSGNPKCFALLETLCNGFLHQHYALNH